MLRLIALAVLLVVGLASPPRVSASPPLGQVTVTSTERAPGVTLYRLRVLEYPGIPVSVIVPYDAPLATLEINGVVVQHTGYDFPVGAAPLGHGSALLRVAGVSTRDDVVVRVWGSSGALRFLFKPAIMANEYGTGFWSGFYYAVLAIVAFFIVVAVCVQRDPTMVWYLWVTLSLIGAELARDDLLPFDQNGNVLGLVVFSLLSGTFVLCFSVSYLRLRTQAPALFKAALFFAVAPVLCVLAFNTVTHRGFDNESLVVPETVGLISSIVISSIRRYGGYRPATFFGLGFLGLTAVFVLKIVRDLAGTPAPFLDRWEFEAGSVFDVLAFAIAVTVRARYAEHGLARSQAGLVAATFDAGHDELTHLINRRGLDALFEADCPSGSTVLFIDLDGFKLINDLGGHAKGDDALRITARILRHSVREADVVARVGGDEFVVVLVDTVDPLKIAEVESRIASSIAFVRPLGDQNATRFGVSIGHSETQAGESLAVAIARADAAAYRVKAEHYANERNVTERRAARRKR